MKNIYWWRGEAMLDTGCLMLVESSVFSGDNKRESFENPASINQHQVSFCFLLKKKLF
jgi:hypothetical protein